VPSTVCHEPLVNLNCAEPLAAGKVICRTPAISFKMKAESFAFQLLKVPAANIVEPTGVLLGNEFTFIVNCAFKQNGNRKVIRRNFLISKTN
jgi:hypothetical protein